MAKALWPGKDAIGQCIRVNADTMPCTYVVGVAEDIKQQSLGVDSALYNYYLPATQFNPNQGGLFVRVHGNAARAADGIRRRLQREMPGASYVTITPIERDHRQQDAVVAPGRDAVRGLWRARARPRGDRVVQRDRLQRRAADPRARRPRRARRAGGATSFASSSPTASASPSPAWRSAPRSRSTRRDGSSRCCSRCHPPIRWSSAGSSPCWWRRRSPQAGCPHCAPRRWIRTWPSGRRE